MNPEDYAEGYRDGMSDTHKTVLAQVADLLDSSPGSWHDALEALKEMKEKAWMYDGLTK